MPFNSIDSSSWPPEFKIVTLGADQKAYFYGTSSQSPKPLVVSLHTWRGDFDQYAYSAAKETMTKNWNYIHPDFRGPNNNPDACCSVSVISDIEDAINYAILKGKVDNNEIYLVGNSGGGYAALCMYFKSKKNIKTFSIWNPISDLTSFYHQAKVRKPEIAEDILNCTNSANNLLNYEEAASRSPFYMSKPKDKSENSKITLYAGIHDGYIGPVPITQSIKMYNEIVKSFPNHKAENLISNITTIQLLANRSYKPNENYGKIENRHIIFRKNFGNLSLIIFEGGHEFFARYAIDNL